MHCRSLFLVLVLLISVAGQASGQDAADQPALRDLNGHFPFTVPQSAEQWQAALTSFACRPGSHWVCTPCRNWPLSNPRSMAAAKWMATRSRR